MAKSDSLRYSPSWADIRYGLDRHFRRLLVPFVGSDGDCRFRATATIAEILATKYSQPLPLAKLHEYLVKSGLDYLTSAQPEQLGEVKLSYLVEAAQYRCPGNWTRDCSSLQIAPKDKTTIAYTGVKLGTTRSTYEFMNTPLQLMNLVIALEKGVEFGYGKILSPGFIKIWNTYSPAETQLSEDFVYRVIDNRDLIASLGNPVYDLLKPNEGVDLMTPLIRGRAVVTPKDGAVSVAIGNSQFTIGRHHELFQANMDREENRK